LSDISVWLVAPSLLIFAPIKKGAAAGLLKIAWKIPLSTILPHRGGGESQANHLKGRAIHISSSPGGRRSGGGGTSSFSGVLKRQEK
jgi:hypothetical protein